MSDSRRACARRSGRAVESLSASQMRLPASAADVYTCALILVPQPVNPGVTALYLEFIIAKWYLVGAWLVMVALVIAHERRRSAQGVSPAALTNLLNREEGTVLDVRPAGEFRTGHIVDSLNIPHTRVAEQIGDLDKYRAKPLVVVCKMGQHSGSVARTLKENGFERVYKLSGGLAEWQSGQLPLVKS